MSNEELFKSDLKVLMEKHKVRVWSHRSGDYLCVDGDVCISETIKDVLIECGVKEDNDKLLPSEEGVHEAG